MPILIAIISILVITGLAIIVRKFTPVKICPICAGVAGTWLWMLAIQFAGGQMSDVSGQMLIISLLMGGSVVGITNALEKRLTAGRSAFTWKLIAMLAGFIAAYGLVTFQWLVAGIGLTAWIIGALWFFRPSNRPADAVTEKLEEKMKNCC